MKKATLIFCAQLAAAALAPAWCFAAKPSAAPTAADEKYLPALRKAVDDCRKGPVDSWGKTASASPWLEQVKSDLMFDEPGANLQACVALERPDRCDSLRLLPEDLYNCRRFKEIVAVVHGVLKGDAPQAACVRYIDLEESGKAMDPALKARTCKKAAAVLRDPRQYDSFCEQIIALGIDPSPNDLKRCREMTIFMKGQPPLCGQPGTQAAWLGYCRVMAGAVAVWKFDQPATCSAVPLCTEAVGGKAPACAPYRAAFDKEYCARATKSLAQVDADAGKARAAAAEELKKQKAIAAATAASAARDEAAAVAAAKARVAADEALVKAKAARMAKEQAAAEAKIKARSDAEARKAAAAKAAIEKQDKPQFTKGEPMKTNVEEMKEILKAAEEGRPLPKPKRKPKPKPVTEDEATRE